MNDEKYMKIALELAAKAWGRTSPNPMVGAVIVKDGEIVGRGYHKKAGTAHAEVYALREAGDKARGGTIYVTLEPCSHQGRTPPCADAIIHYGIARAVVAMVDPNPLVAGKGIEKLKSAGIEVEIGVMEEEAKKLNEIFIKYITTGKPFVLLKTAMTMDGKIAAVTGDSRWVTGEEARACVHRIRDRYDAVMVGIGTVLTDNPYLTTRLPDGKGRDPVRIIVDSRARTPVNANVINLDSDAYTIIAVTPQAPLEKVKDLERAGAKVITIPGNSERVDLQNLILKLGKMEISSILLEGGSELNASALEAGIVDKVLWFIAPKIIGGKDAPGPVGGAGSKLMAQAVNLRDVKIGKIGDDIYVEGYIPGKG